ncbi:MAG TPA: 50S ribosomal protein L29 [Candidatus Nanoarchaeia archaeon]|nr:50S ribosomal protein L29 [Candidatus Nanoarchaeia archaeon]
MKRKEIRDIPPEELPGRIAELRKDLIRENVQRAAGSAKNPGKMREMKKNIARMLTMISMKKEGG